MSDSEQDSATLSRSSIAAPRNLCVKYIIALEITRRLTADLLITRM
jgi:hypothetical protein